MRISLGMPRRISTVGTIEPATADDLPAIAKLNVDAYREFADAMTAEGWRSMEASLRAVEARAHLARFVVVRDSDAIIGSVAYSPQGQGSADFFPPHWAAILSLAVSPAHRGRDIARSLVTACIEYALADEVPVIGLYTSELMTAAQGLYKAFGFRRDAELARRYGLRYWRYRLDLILNMPNVK